MVVTGERKKGKRRRQTRNQPHFASQIYFFFPSLDFPPRPTEAHLTTINPAPLLAAPPDYLPPTLLRSTPPPTFPFLPPPPEERKRKKIIPPPHPSSSPSPSPPPPPPINSPPSASAEQQKKAPISTQLGSIPHQVFEQRSDPQLQRQTALATKTRHPSKSCKAVGPTVPRLEQNPLSTTARFVRLDINSGELSRHRSLKACKAKPPFFFLSERCQFL
jgi:hypothetical protein